MLKALGQTAFKAAAVISVGSWVMSLSGTVCGQIADRTSKHNLVLTVCMSGAAAALVLLTVDGAGMGASILFGLVGMAPAGVIMALVGEAMRPERCAVGIGVFFTVYYTIMTATPPITGWMFDATGSVKYPIFFAVFLFVAVVPTALLFRCIKGREDHSGK
jgi:MFS family permease